MNSPLAASVLTREPPLDTLLAMTLLSFFAILLLPRQFHVTVVENNNEREIKRARWLFPLYLVLINLFVVPIAIAGLLTFPAGQVDSDMFVLALPLQAGSSVLTIAAFVGGLSAATAMVIVETVALAIMVSNDIVVPWVLQRREALITGREDVGSLLLTVRRLAIFAILLFAYLYYRFAGDAQLAAIGLLSFAAIAQLAPAFFGGLIWRRATARGAIAGMTVGILTWAYTLLLPTFADTGLPRRRPVGHRLAAAAAPVRARPAAAGARRGLEPCAQHPRLYRLLARRAPTAIERMQADVFVPTHLAPITPSFRLWRSSVTVEELTTTVARYLGEERTRSSFESFAADTAHQPAAATRRRISSCCATPSICSPRRSAPPRRGSCCRCCCASARSRPRPRSSCSTTPTRRSTTTAKSCRPRSIMCARASPSTTRTCGWSAGTASSAKSSICRPS